MKKTVIIGNVGQDAQLKSTQQGSQYLSFSVAVTEKRNGQESTTWFSCSGWGERFVTGQIGQYIKKGVKVYIEGNYTPSLFNRNDGTVDISHNLMVNQIELLGSVPQQTATPTAPAAQPTPQTYGNAGQPAPVNAASPSAQPAMQNTSDRLQAPSVQDPNNPDDDLPF